MGGPVSNTIFGGDPNGNPNGPDSLGGNFEINYVGDGTGTFTDVSYIQYFSFDPISNLKTGYYCQGCAVTINITSDDGPGGFIEGNFNGEAEEFSTGTTIPISGDFRIERD